MSTAIGDIAKCGMIVCNTAKCDELQVDSVDCGTLKALHLDIKTDVQPDRISATHSILIKINEKSYKMLLADIETEIPRKQ